jgi:hypothetical protein
MPSLWYKSRSVEFDVGPSVAVNAQAFFFLAGVPGSPITVYSDAAEGSPHPNPVLADGNGRWPAVFVPYMAAYGVRVLNEANVQLWSDDNIPNPDPVEVTGTLPPGGLLETGMFHWEPIQGVKAGYVRANGRSIGNAASSATERANADTENLFIYLWNAMADGQAAVLPGGRGGSAASDFAANKRIALPDLRGGGLRGLDDMGNSAAATFTGLTFDHGSAILAGSYIGRNFYTLTAGQLPGHSHTASTGSTGAHTHGGVTGTTSVDHTHSVNFASGAAGSHTHTGSADSGGAHTHTGTAQSAGSHSHTIAAAVLASSAQTGGSFFTWGAGTTTTSTDGAHTHTLTVDSGGAHTHTLTVNSVSDHTHTVIGSSTGQSQTHTHTIASDGAHTHTVTVDPTGNFDLISNTPRSILGTWYVKL